MSLESGESSEGNKMSGPAGNDQRGLNLNLVAIEDHTGDHTRGPVLRELREAHTSDGKTSVYFDGLEGRLCDLIEDAEAVLGCVAWLTSEPILTALAKKQTVAIVVQKEDFLRPDLQPRRGWENRLRFLYDSLRCGHDRYCFDNRVGVLSTSGDCRLHPVRCAGVYNRERSAAAPRMHHKFLLFGNIADVDRTDCYGDTWQESRIRPYAVWTGSFNLTRNATYSLENAVVLRDEAVVAAYYEEWAHIESLSEPLDWEAPWSEPQWRLGT